MKKTVSCFLFWFLLCNSVGLLAQTEPEAIEPESDKFQDYFYESLKQKGIENYDLAILELEKCIKIKPNQAIIYSELGKNYLGQKKYQDAYDSFEKATQIEPKNKWFWAGMYDASYQSKNYNQAISAVNRLIEFNELYKDDLVELYMNTQQFDSALELINDLNEKVGRSKRRDAYKTQILSQGKYQNSEIENLLNQINKNPTIESNYFELIKLYSKNNQNDKAAEISKKLQLAIPTSEWAQVGRFSNYLAKNELQKAVSAINIIAASTTIDYDTKNLTFKDFLIAVNKKPAYFPDLEKVIAFFEKDKEVLLAKEIGKYYYQNKQWVRAILFFENALANTSIDDVETSLYLLQSYVETKQFDVLARKATYLMEIFPSQPQFYFFAGLANNQLKQYKNAITILEMGLDYIVTDLVLETNFNIQLGEAHNGTGDFKKRDIYFTKANKSIKVK